MRRFDPIKTERRVGWMKVVAIVVATALAVVLWITFFDKMWPANGAESRPIACTTENPCEHPKATEKQFREWRAGELYRTRPRLMKRIIGEELERKMKRAYRRYTEAHPCGPQGCEGGVQEGATARAVAYDWPSPREWFNSFASSVGCAFVGATPSAAGTYCSAGGNDMLEKTGKLSNEVGRVTIKCGGALVLGGLGNESAKEVIRKMGWRVSGGVGIYAAGAACAWNEYFDQWWWTAV